MLEISPDRPGAAGTRDPARPAGLPPDALARRLGSLPNARLSALCGRVWSEALPENTMAEAERWAASLPNPAYAIDDDTAIVVTGGVFDVVSEGHWRLFTRDRLVERDRPGDVGDRAQGQASRAHAVSRRIQPQRPYSGKLRPTLEQLLPLARAYGVPLDDLVAAPPTGDPRIHLRPVRRFGLTVIPLTRRAGGVQAYKVIYPPAGRAATMKPQAHDGYEWFYVLDGRVRFVLGEQEFQLGVGEAAEFDTHTPHWIGSAGSQPAELITLFGAQGERIHLSSAQNRNPHA